MKKLEKAVLYLHDVGLPTILLTLLCLLVGVVAGLCVLQMSGSKLTARIVTVVVDIVLIVLLVKFLRDHPLRRTPRPDDPFDGSVSKDE